MTPVKKRNDYNDCGGRHVSDIDDLLCGLQRHRLSHMRRHVMASRFWMILRMMLSGPG